VLIKQASDLHVSTLNQMVMHEVASEIIDTHGAKILAAYKKNRDAALAALDKYMPPGVTWTRPEGGMFIWVTLPPQLDGALLLERAIREIKVAFVPGAAFYADRSQRNHIRLSFSVLDEAAIDEGIKRLGGMLQKA